jgi:N-carbamoylputrescine amidase
MKHEHRVVRVGVVQCALGGPTHENVERLTHWVRAAAQQGAQVIALPELFEGPYFCRTEDNRWFEQAQPLTDTHPSVRHFRKLAKELAVVLPLSVFERDGHHYYNSVMMVNADGEPLGVYRKSHIPDGPGYEEKFYFRPGNTGFKTWRTPFGVIGVGICWDQWFPEAARAMALQGAELLLYPTAIGSEPEDAALDTKDPWQRVMIGHAVANAMPVAAANRVGSEEGQVFYGSSFIANPRGDKVVELGRQEEGVRVAEFDLDALRASRAGWGFFRDRRTDLYDAIAERR